MQLETDKRYLMLVESPEKAKTITKIFKETKYRNVVVMATVGHFIKINDGSGYYNTGIYPEKNFAVDYVVDPKKLAVVQKLKDQVKVADFVFLCADPDREGEAIAWSCLNFLNIPRDKVKRVTYQAINKKALFEALDKAHDLDEDLVAAAQSRSILDKGLGYRLSTLSRQQGLGKSVGRVQSAALRMICDREREIINFVPEHYIDLYLKFIKNNVEFKAKYQGTDDAPIKKLQNQWQVDDIFSTCKGHPFIVTAVENKDKKENPKPPFSTATFQQECANKLGLTVKQSADCAQKLFDAGKISYHRTDTEYLMDEFTQTLLDYVKETFPKKYVSGTVVKGKKQENSQEGHEALHVLDLTLTPELYAQSSPNELLTKVYRIIYNRTVAAALSPAIISQTVYTIHNGEHKFVMNSNELRFDGYRKIYAYKEEEADKESVIKETFEENEVLHKCSFDVVQQITKPKPRYTEAGFVKEMKEAGIGRPSTYASTIETIKSKDRGYCLVEDKCLRPTELGMQEDEFLMQNFPYFINVEYTSEMENSLDEIAAGKLDKLTFLKKVFETLEENAQKITVGAEANITCPNCGAPMVYRRSRFGAFYGCSTYPKCRAIVKIKNQEK